MAPVLIEHSKPRSISNWPSFTRKAFHLAAEAEAFSRSLKSVLYGGGKLNICESLSRWIVVTNGLPKPPGATSRRRERFDTLTQPSRPHLSLPRENPPPPKHSSIHPKRLCADSRGKFGRIRPNADHDTLPSFVEAKEEHWFLGARVRSRVLASALR